MIGSITYTVVKYVGDEIYGKTFKAYKDGDQDTELALKVIWAETRLDGAKLEVQITKHVRGDWVLDIFHSKKGDEVDLVFMVTPFAVKRDVWDGQIATFPHLLKFMEDMADELILLAERNVFHLNVKPYNIVRRLDGRHILGDFGISQHVGHGEGEFLPIAGDYLFLRSGFLI